MSKWPPIEFTTPEQVAEVYDHIRETVPLRLPIRLAYAALNHYYDPQIAYDEGARADLERINLDGNPHIYVYNHQNQDYLTVGAIMHEVAPNDVGRIRTLSNDVSFRKFRAVAEAWGGIPVARKVDYEDDLEAVRKTRLATAESTYEKLFSCCVDLLRAGQPLALYPEGAVNKHESWLYPAYVDTAKNGVGVIAVRAASPELPTAITPISHTNGPGNLNTPKRSHVSAYVGRTIFVQPHNSVPDVTYRVRKSLQHGVTKASATR